MKQIINLKSLIMGGLVLSALTAASIKNANASAVIFITGSEATSNVALGINDEGHLNTSVDNIVVNSGSTGLAFKFPDGSWRDATSPGCLCEGWGVAANGIVGYADIDSDGISNLTVDSFASTPSTATSITHLTSLPGVSIQQEYAPSASGALFMDHVTITNTTGATATDVRYRRVMDWDIPPTEFTEFVTLQGWPATALIDSCNDGFAIPDPLVDCSIIGGPGAVEDGNFTDAGPADHGASFTFGFGDLADGESKSFDIFYGAAPTEALAMAALGTVGAEVFSLGQDGDPVTGTPATFVFGFAGVGGTPVSATPEPGTILLLGNGILLFAVSKLFSKKLFKRLK